MIQGMGGLMSVTGERDDRAGGGPQKAGIPIADLITGMYASVAICAALAHRAKSGTGPAPRPRAARFAGRRARQPGRELPRHRRVAGAARQRPSQHRALPGVPDRRRQRDRRLRQRQPVPQVLRGRPAASSWRDDARFATNGKRVENRAELTRILSRDHSRSAACANGSTRSKPPACRAGRSTIWSRCSTSRRRRRAACASSCRIRARGKVPLVRSPMRFSETPVSTMRRPPTLGQHTDEVLRGLLGKSDAEIARLRSEGII